MILLLIGSRYGSESTSTESWTEREIRYAIRKGKRVYAYLRELDTHDKNLIDPNVTKAELLSIFIKKVESYIPNIPRFCRGENFRLVALAVRDVVRYREELKQAERTRAYQHSFE